MLMWVELMMMVLLLRQSNIVANILIAFTHKNISSNGRWVLKKDISFKWSRVVNIVVTWRVGSRNEVVIVFISL